MCTFSYLKRHSVDCTIVLCGVSGCVGVKRTDANANNVSCPIVVRHEQSIDSVEARILSNELPITRSQTNLESLKDKCRLIEEDRRNVREGIGCFAKDNLRWKKTVNQKRSENKFLSPTWSAGAPASDGGVTV